MTVGRKTDKQVEILDGLKEGEKVVLEPSKDKKSSAESAAEKNGPTVPADDGPAGPASPAEPGATPGPFPSLPSPGNGGPSPESGEHAG